MLVKYQISGKLCPSTKYYYLQQLQRQRASWLMFLYPQLWRRNAVTLLYRCDTGGDCECLCTSIANFAAACAHFGICVSWRSQNVCRKLYTLLSMNTPLSINQSKFIFRLLTHNYNVINAITRERLSKNIMLIKTGHSNNIIRMIRKLELWCY